jgi:transcriptional regulator with XRE-family HTH domain
MKRSRLFEILKQRDLPAREFADLIGISVRTLHNVACGNSKSLVARQRITNALQTVVWAGVEVTERLFTFSPGTEMEFPSAKAALDGVDELPPGVVKWTGKVLTFIQPTTFAIQIQPEETQGAKNRNLSADSSE